MSLDRDTSDNSSVPPRDLIWIFLLLIAASAGMSIWGGGAIPTERIVVATVALLLIIVGNVLTKEKS